ncbi:MAG TPA: PQQ-binding-like beta-propeller repeat protein, partial [bacterium]|nr:PQQ-binding-like beta-propeller repeat protein [bacterium]
ATVPGPEQASLKWKFKADAAIVSSPAIGSDGSVYFTSEKGTLYALAPDGTLRWSFRPGGTIRSSPALGSDGTVYLSTYVSSGEGALCAVSATGSLKWKLTTTGGNFSSPVIDSEGTIYVGSGDRCLYALKSDGTVRWKFQTEGPVFSSPVIGFSGEIYVGSSDGSLYGFNPEGKLLFRVVTGSAITHAPSVGPDGTIYLGNQAGYFYGVSGGGTERWKYSFGAALVSSPAIDFNGRIYVGAGNFLAALDGFGKLKWLYRTENTVESSPAVDSQNNFYFGCNDGHLYCIDRNGRLKWKFALGSPAGAASPAIGADGTVFSGCSDGTFYALGAPPSLERFEVSPISSPQKTGVAFLLKITARDRSGQLYRQFNGVVSLSDLTGTISPASTGNFTEGYWEGNVTINAVKAGNVITVAAQGKSGSSNAFDVVGGQVKIITPSLASGYTGRFYRNRVLADGGEKPYFWSLVSGQLPPGLTLTTANSQACVEGTPASAGVYSFQIQVTDSSTPPGSDRRDFSLSITQPLAWLKVLSPAGGESWDRDSLQLIRWQYTGQAGRNVEIALLDGEEVAAIVSDGVSIGREGQGSYPWKPAGIAEGSRYRMRITSKEYPWVSDASAQFFSIHKKSIAVVAPEPGAVWYTGTTASIRWQYTGDPGNQVRMELYQGGKRKGLISAGSCVGQAGEGTQTWAIPLNLTPGDNYLIRVTSYRYPSLFAESGSFSISHGSIAVVAPMAGEIWPAGSSQTIRWQYQGFPGSQVTVQLWKSGLLLGTITTASPGQQGEGFCPWSIP